MRLAKRIRWVSLLVWAWCLFHHPTSSYAVAFFITDSAYVSYTECVGNSGDYLVDGTTLRARAEVTATGPGTASSYESIACVEAELTVMAPTHLYINAYHDGLLSTEAIGITPPLTGAQAMASSDFSIQWMNAPESPTDLDYISTVDLYTRYSYSYGDFITSHHEHLLANKTGSTIGEVNEVLNTNSLLDLSYTRLFSIEAWLDPGTYIFQGTLYASASVSTGSSGNSAYAKSDFWNTASLTFTTSLPSGSSVIATFGTPSASVPEPSTLLLAGTGLLGVAGLRGLARRRGLVSRRDPNRDLL